MALTPELTEELTKFVALKFTELPDFSDDVKEISEYIVLLIANGRSAEETYTEVQDLVSSEGLQTVIQSTYKALEDYQRSQNSQAEQQQAHAANTVVPSASSSSSQPSSQPSSQQSSSSNHIIPSAPSALANRIGIPTKPGNFNGRTAAQRGGISISKARVGNGINKNHALRNPESFQRALELSNTNGANTSFTNSRGQLKKKGRCHKFPHCPNVKDCLYAHPTKPCFQFPECPNPPGTCNYLHPGEDDELIAELEKTRKTFQEQRQSKIARFVQNNTGIALCKYGVVCTNQQCPFGHPTPANEDAKVITLEWCADNLKCEDPSCTKAHSSLSKIKEIKPANSSSNGSHAYSAAPNSTSQEKSLDPCKFGLNCTNRFCKFRHATSPVMCRDGAACTRIDCFFSHPINEVCRFSEGCKNPKCLFQHPNGKSIPEGTIPAKSLTWTKTNERQFAVPDEEVLEHAPAQEG